MKDLSRAAMAADLERLVHYLTTAHPDPYRGFGGPVPFYRAVARIEADLPARTTRDAFLARLRPLIAGLRDGHTTIHGPDLETSPGRVWLDFGMVERTVYVQTVYAAKDTRLLGARVLAIADEPVQTVADRVAGTVGCDNAIDVLRHLVQLFRDPDLARAVLPEGRVDPLGLTCERVDGRRETVAVPWVSEAPGEPLSPPSAIALPPLGPAQLGWGFLDDAGRVACLRVGTLMRYREAAETWRQTGYRRALDDWYHDVYGSVRRLPDAEMDSFIASRPAASDVLAAMGEAVQARQTEWVIVDCSLCPGGNSTFASILAWFLFGEDAVMGLDDGYQIRRYSPLYAHHHGSIPDPGALAHGGYDFREEATWLARRAGSRVAGGDAREEWRAWVSGVPTFERAVSTGRRAPIDARVVVITGAETYSAGFDVALTLRKLGALHVGVPSSQAPNCFIDVLPYTLPNSGLTGHISFKESFALPAEALPERLLAPEVPLTYAQLTAYGFDPAAGIRLALDAILGHSDS